MIFLLAFIIILFVFHFSILKNNKKNNISLIIFTIFYLLYTVYPYFFNQIYARNEFYLGSNIYVNTSLMQRQMFLVITIFYVIFCFGNFCANILINKNNLVVSLTSIINKINSNLYDKSIILINILIIFFFIFFFLETFLLSINSYYDNVSLNFGSFVFLKEFYFLVLSLTILIYQPVSKYKILLFFIFIIGISFLTSDKDPLLYIIIFFYYYIFNFKKIKPSINNLIIIFFFMSIIIMYFIPLFSILRGNRDLFYSLDFILSHPLTNSGDAESGLSILYLLINETLQIKPYNYLYNFFSFLPENLRINGDYAVDFAKVILGDLYQKGYGFSFSVIAESLIIFKYYGSLAFFLLVFATGAVFSFSNYLIIILFPEKFKMYILIYFSTMLSIIIVRSTSAGLYQFIFRFLIISLSFIFLQKFLKFIISKFNQNN